MIELMKNSISEVYTSFDNGTANFDKKLTEISYR